MPGRFAPDDLDAVRQARVADILTGPQAERRTTIWSVRGPRGRWYRDLLADPAGTLNLGDRRIPFVAQRADDPDRIAACSAALRAKFRPGVSLDSMLAEHTLPTTFELVPR